MIFNLFKKKEKKFWEMSIEELKNYSIHQKYECYKEIADVFTKYRFMIDRKIMTSIFNFLNKEEKGNYEMLKKARRKLRKIYD